MRLEPLVGAQWYPGSAREVSLRQPCLLSVFADLHRQVVANLTTRSRLQAFDFARMVHGADKAIFGTKFVDNYKPPPHNWQLFLHWVTQSLTRPADLVCLPGEVAFPAIERRDP